MDCRHYARLLKTWVVICLLFCISGTASLFAQSKPSMFIEIDGRDLPRKLLNSTQRIPLPASETEQQVRLWYPRWVPGSHGPGGPIANVAGLTFSTSSGQPLKWSRVPGEVYSLLVRVPAGVTELRVNLRYIANQPTTNSMGHDTFGSSMLGIISPGTILLYRDGDLADQTMIEGRLFLPKGWQAASALGPWIDVDDQSLGFKLTSLQNFVDSPIMCGQYYKSYSLNTQNTHVKIAPHELHLFSEQPNALELDPEIITRLKNMVHQAALMTGSQPFDRFDILLAATDQLPANGLEHSRSTLNVLSIASLRHLSALKGWSRLLIPHEYLHAWCGKYRRPQAMIVDDFHTAGGTDLLWVYEGLTQYLGELTEARCGLMTADEFRDRLGVELRNAVHQQNRLWRPLVDTGAASHVLRDSSPSWPKLRGSQDYYMEGMLFWLEADAVIRRQSGGKNSLDDFCKLFFACEKPAADAQYSRALGYSRQDVIDTLNAITDYDWDGLISRRIESTIHGFDTHVANLLGYTFQATSTRPPVHPATFRLPSGIDHFDTLGMTLSADGTITDIRLGSPADSCRLGPGLKIVGINGKKWKREVLDEAIQHSATEPEINLLIEEGYLLKNITLTYNLGYKYLSLVRDEEQEDLLQQILQPR